jgi:adenine-specific DNA-methyltransferase
MMSKLGSFYTPERVAQVLTDWAIRDPNAKVLDPSFGGCAFLCAALTSLKNLGNQSPGANIFGVDVDPDAQRFLDPLISAGARGEQYPLADFFDVSPQHLLPELFDAIVGNPPYVRYHSIPTEMRAKAVERLSKYGLRISGRASYWAFFLLYSVHFLKPGGRLAMILPGALLHTDYAMQLRDLIKSNFESVHICLLDERIFQDTNEESVLVFADGAHKSHRQLHISNARDVQELVSYIGNEPPKDAGLASQSNEIRWLRALLDTDVQNLYQELSRRQDVIFAGDWVETRIGVVTGNNDYFILSEQEWEKYQLPVGLQIPIVRKAIQLKGLKVTEQELNDSQNANTKYLLFGMSAEHLELTAVRQYIEQGENTGVHKRRKCSDRKPWYIVPHTASPPAFMPIMSASWPRLIINESGYTCTNNILKVFWKESRNAVDWLRLAVGTLSTLSQLSAELVGRSYGGGVLKLEPKEFASLVIPILPEPDVLAIAPVIDTLLRNGKASQASKVVDQAMLGANFSLSQTDIDILVAARNKLFMRRRQHRQDSRKILYES